MIDDKISWEKCSCEEASMHSRGTYVPCGERAVALVWHDRDRRAYLMCLPCADHNLRNRGGLLLATNMPALRSRYDKAPQGR